MHDQYPTQAKNSPDVEDLNNDQNLSETEAYFQYEVSLATGRFSCWTKQY